MNRRIAWCLLLLLTVGCQQEMARQPSYRPLEPSAFFPDGRSARPLIDGTVARDRPLQDSRLLTWFKAPQGDRAAAAVGAALIGAGAADPLAALLAAVAG